MESEFAGDLLFSTVVCAFANESDKKSTISNAANL
jgi:hypothetical protein